MKHRRDQLRLAVALFFLGLVLPPQSSSLAFIYHPFDTKSMDLELTGIVGEVFDDNVTYVKENKKSDLITEIALGIKAVYRGARQQWDLLVESRQQIFAKNSDFSNNDQDMKFNYEYELTKKDRIKVKNDLSHYYEPRSFDEQFGREGGRYSYFTDAMDVRYTKDLNGRWSVMANAGGGLNFVSKKDRQDSFEIKSGVGTEYKLSSKLITRLRYDLSFRKFIKGLNSSIHAFTGGVRHYFTERFYADGEAGVQVIDSYDNKTIVTPSFIVSLNQLLDQKSVASLSFENKSITTSFSNSILEQRRISLNFMRQIWKRLSGAVAAFYGWGEYSSTKVKEDFFGASVSLIYEITDRWKAILSYSFSLLDSSVEGSGYERNVAGIRFSYNF